MSTQKKHYAKNDSDKPARHRRLIWGNRSDKEPSDHSAEHTANKQNVFIKALSGLWHSYKIRQLIADPRAWMEVLALITVICYTRYTHQQTEVLKSQFSLSASTQIPFLFLKEMPQSTENFGDEDVLIKWSQVWHNSGGSKPVSLNIWTDCRPAMTTEDLDFYRRRNRAGGLKVVIGPQTDRTIVGCETSYSYLKSIDDSNLARASKQDDVRTTMYVFGGAAYGDSFGGSHTVEYCYQVYWDNRRVKLGFHLVECQAPYQSHNCTDEECGGK